MPKRQVTRTQTRGRARNAREAGIRAGAFRDAADLITRMVEERERFFATQQWPPSMLQEMIALRNAAAMLRQTALWHDVRAQRAARSAAKGAAR